MAIDESFKKPGSIPFKWEIKPGVPKHQPKQAKQERLIQSSRPQQLRPPPSSESRTASFRSDSISGSGRYNANRVDVVSIGCFQPSAMLLKRRSSLKKRGDCYASDAETPSRLSVSSRNSVVSPFREPPATSFCSSSPPRLSVSSRKSVVSPFRESPATSFCGSSDPSSSSSSPSPLPVSDAEWAGFGLF